VVCDDEAAALGEAIDTDRPMVMIHGETFKYPSGSFGER
jgi:hypothetical protein